MKYQLRIQIEIQRVGEHGEYLGQAGNLQVTEDILFDATSFLEIASVLGEFHELSQKIREVDR